MEEVRDTIKSFKIDNDEMLLICIKNTYVLDIKEGSIDLDIINEYKEIIGINELDIDDNILIIYKKIDKKLEKKYIKPIKIIKLFKYEFNNDTSDSDNLD